MNSRKQQGFTITELVIAMAFISFLLLFIMFGIVQIMRIYSKGIAVRELNQAGRQFAEDFTRTARYSSGVIAPTGLNRICTNGVTYAWNLGDPTATGAPNPNKFNSGVTDGSDITMVKLPGDYCGVASPSPLPRSGSSEVLGDGLNVQSVRVVPDRELGKVATVSVVFSTGGVNAPVADVTSPTGFRCKSGVDGAYCALADFDATVYVRNGN